MTPQNQAQPCAKTDIRAMRSSTLQDTARPGITPGEGTFQPAVLALITAHCMPISLCPRVLTIGCVPLLLYGESVDEVRWRYLDDGGEKKPAESGFCLTA